LARPVLKVEEILNLLPHRYPFLLVDRVIALDPGKSIAAIKNVTANESFFEGHFPEVKIMPGVLIVEAVAQAGGILLYHSLPDAAKKLVVLSKLQNVKFRKIVVPGDQMRLEAEIIKVRPRFAKIRGRAIVDKEIVVEGEIAAAIIDLEEANAPK
jgi:3-hydroxyacyl-[acyl-carrier-protein] dehydratase/UDP-3-O-[3-hydroxymyristoyl] N-acetylglucosamine deacetylase/3-hydroxyacyl-[acyl-carrier-protein] dehydratase